MSNAGNILRCATALLASASLPAQSPAERGKYLVEEVAKCQMCHSPKGETGEYDRTRWLKGAVLDFQPLQPVTGWHKTSPDLSSGSKLWKNWGEDGILRYLQTGLNPKGKPADPPMPAYKFTKQDAEAVVAYLKTLKPAE